MKRGLLLLAALLPLATSATAVGKVDIDPNSPGAGTAVTVLGTDTRLDQKVTVDARRQTVSAILADLSKQSGVKLYAGFNNLDWQVRDRWMNVFATDTPLKDLMDSIARVMKFKWSRKELNGEWTYRLYMDRKTLLGVERQRLLEEERLSKLEDRQRERVLADLTKAATMSHEELEGLRATDPMLYNEVKMGWAALVPHLLARIPAAKTAWTSGDALTLNAADLPAESQRAVVKTFGLLGAYMTKVHGPDQGPPKAAFEDLSKVAVSINASRQSGGSRGGIWICDTDLAWPGMTMRTSFVDPDSPAVQALGRAYIRRFDGEAVDGRELQELTLSLEAQRTGFGEPLTEHPKDPALQAKVKLKPMGDSFADLLRAVSKASGYAVVSDSFPIYNRGFGPANSDIVLQDALDKLSIQYCYNWDRQGGVLAFRDREWFRKRGYQVPESWLEPWRRSLERAGTLTLDELACISLLDQDQVRENLHCDDVFAASGILPGRPTSEGDFLQAYACLNADQKKAAFTDAGLDLSTVSPSQWDRVARMFRSKPLIDATPNAGIVLTCVKSSEEGWPKYSVAAASAGGTSAKWDVWGPKYDLSRLISRQPWAGVATRAAELLADAKKTKLADHHAWYHLGLLLYDGKRYPAALEAFARSCLLAEKRPQLLFGPLMWKGHVLDLTGRRDEAIACYNAARKIEMGEKVARYGYDLTIDRKWVESRLKTPFERK